MPNRYQNAIESLTLSALKKQRLLERLEVEVQRPAQDAPRQTRRFIPRRAIPVAASVVLLALTAALLLPKILRNTPSHTNPNVIVETGFLALEHTRDGERYYGFTGSFGQLRWALEDPREPRAFLQSGDVYYAVYDTDQPNVLEINVLEQGQTRWAFSGGGLTEIRQILPRPDGKGILVLGTVDGVEGISYYTLEDRGAQGFFTTGMTVPGTEGLTPLSDSNGCAMTEDGRLYLTALNEANGQIELLVLQAQLSGGDQLGLLQRMPLEDYTYAGLVVQPETNRVMVYGLGTASGLTWSYGLWTVMDLNLKVLHTAKLDFQPLGAAATGDGGYVLGGSPLVSEQGAKSVGRWKAAEDFTLLTSIDGTGTVIPDHEGGYYVLNAAPSARISDLLDEWLLEALPVDKSVTRYNAESKELWSHTWNASPNENPFVIPLRALPRNPNAPLPTETAVPPDVIQWADPNIERAARSQTGKPYGDVLRSDVAGIRQLILPNSNVQTVEDLRYFTGLEELNLDQNHISDLAPLSGLNRLSNLMLRENQIKDIGPLSGLTQLMHLDLSGNQIEDAEPLSGLTNLKTLLLSDNQIAFETALSKLTGLETLRLDHNRLNSISWLAGLRELRELTIRGNDIITGLSAISRMTELQNLDIGELGELDTSNLTVLKNLTKLQFLDAGGTLVQDISALAGLTDLQELNLDGIPIEDLTPLSGLNGLSVLSLNGSASQEGLSALGTLTSLNTLSLKSCGITNLDALNVLAQQGKLTTLDVSGNNISDLHPLVGMKLIRLNLSGNAISDLTPLSEIKTLYELNLESNAVSDLTPLAALENLTTLLASHNKISDIGALPSRLQSLTLNGNSISDISVISSRTLASLESLSLFNNQISDIGSLSGMGRLSSLNLGANRIIDISPLSGLSRMASLNLSQNEIVSIQPLAGLTRLTECLLDNNQISDLTPLAEMHVLNALYLAHNQIRKLDPLSGVSLTVLTLDGNPIVDFTPLSAQVRLQILSLGQCQISDLAPLSGLTRLTELILISNRISDLNPLSGLTELAYLELSFNQISDVTPLSGLVKLEFLGLNNNPLEGYETLYGLNIQHLELDETWTTAYEPVDLLRNGGGGVQRIEISHPQQNGVSWYAVRVLDGAGQTVFTEEAHFPHAGYNTLFLVRREDGDCLLRYQPGIWNGWATYSFRVFRLSEQGEELALEDGSFDFCLSTYESDCYLDLEKAVDFFERLNVYLKDAELLIATDDLVLSRLTGGAYTGSQDAPVKNLYEPFYAGKSDLYAGDVYEPFGGTDGPLRNLPIEEQAREYMRDFVAAAATFPARQYPGSSIGVPGLYYAAQDILWRAETDYVRESMENERVYVRLDCGQDIGFDSNGEIRFTLNGKSLGASFAYHKNTGDLQGSPAPGGQRVFWDGARRFVVAFDRADFDAAGPLTLTVDGAETEVLALESIVVGAIVEAAIG